MGGKEKGKGRGQEVAMRTDGKCALRSNKEETLTTILATETLLAIIKYFKATWRSLYRAERPPKWRGFGGSHMSHHVWPASPFSQGIFAVSEKTQASQEKDCT